MYQSKTVFFVYNLGSYRPKEIQMTSREKQNNPLVLILYPFLLATIIIVQKGAAILSLVGSVSQKNVEKKENV